MLLIHSLNARHNRLRLVLVSTALILLGLMLLFWWEVRNEIYFLCSNFSLGVSEASVLTQVQTGEFLSYRLANSDDGGGVVVFSSPLSVLTGECIVSLGSDRLVREAVYR